MRRAQNNVLINDVESIEKAIQDYEHAKTLLGEEGSGELDQNIKDAKIALKQAKRKDYYKILGCAVRIECYFGVLFFESEVCEDDRLILNCMQNREMQMTMRSRRLIERRR